MSRTRLSFCLWLLLLLWVHPLRAADQPTAEPQFFDSDGVKIHYIVQGEGEPVLLIHGFTGSIQGQWGAPGIIDRLAKSFQVIALDNRGHGKSDKPHEPEQYGQHMVEDAVRLLDHLGIEKAHVVGYSMGGFITSRLLADYPDRLLSATLGGAGWARQDDARLASMDELADSLERGDGLGPLIRRLTPAGRTPPSDEQMKALSQIVLMTNDAKALAAVVRGMKGLYVTEEQVRANSVPTLALIGEIDPLKEGVDALVGLMPQLEVVVIADADHMTAFGRAEFIDALEKFLAAHAAELTAEPVSAAQ